MKLITSTQTLTTISGGNYAVLACSTVFVGLIGASWGILTTSYLKANYPRLPPLVVFGAAFVASTTTAVMGSIALRGLYSSTRNLVYGFYDQCPA